MDYLFETKRNFLFFVKSHKIQTFHSHRVPIITYLFKKITPNIAEKSRKKPQTYQITYLNNKKKNRLPNPTLW